MLFLGRKAFLVPVQELMRVAFSKFAGRRSRWDIVALSKGLIRPRRSDFSSRSPSGINWVEAGTWIDASRWRL